MSLNIRTVADRDIHEIIKEPRKLELLHYGDFLDPAQHENDEIKSELLNWKPSGESSIFYLEAAFQSLHYLLTGETESKGTFPSNFLMCKRIGIGEIGWGHANFYKSKDVKDIHDYLKDLNFSELEKRYNADFFNQSEIYPKGYVWKENDIDSLLTTLKRLIEFIRVTTENGLGIYITIV